MFKIFQNYIFCIMDIVSKFNVYTLLFTMFFPRIGILLLKIKFGNIWWILGYIFYPRFIIAYLVTSHYYSQSKFLVFCIWYWAYIMEKAEKRIFVPMFVSFFIKLKNSIKKGNDK